MTSSKPDFIPALSHQFLTPLYPLVEGIMFRRAFPKLVTSIKVEKDDSMLDIACGTATLLRKIHKKNPDAKLTGLDIDPDILKIAKKKIGDDPIKLIEASATDLPFKDHSFEVVSSTAAFHHLTTQQKKEALKEIHRVLKPGSTFWYFDFVKPKGFLGKLSSLIYRHFEEIEDGIQDRIPGIISDAGFKSVKTHWNGVLGLFGLISAQK